MNDAIAEGFARWRAQFRDGLTAKRDRGELRPEADPDQLATSLMAAFQGGLGTNVSLRRNGSSRLRRTL